MVTRSFSAWIFRGLSVWISLLPLPKIVSAGETAVWTVAEDEAMVTAGDFAPPEQPLDDFATLARLESVERQLARMEAELEQPSGADPADYRVVYENGFVLRPQDSNRSPFELKFEFHNQFRYTLFESDADVVVTDRGRVFTTPDRNDFDINRGRLVFSGYAFDPALEFYVNIDYSTVTSNSIQPLLGWIKFNCHEAMQLYLGLGKVPGSWEWQQTSRYTLGVDRSLATTFFRPSISAGVWANGQPFDGVFYSAFVGDGFNTLGIPASELDTNWVYSLMGWYEPWASFGTGFSDIKQHDKPALRLGHAFTTTRNDSHPDTGPGVEGTVIRLSDGTQLISEDALVVGESVNAFDIVLYSVHAGLKWRGCSLSGEYYVRSLRNIELTNQQNYPSIHDHGFYAQGGTFLIPQRLEGYARRSWVDGDFGTGGEWAAGFNWYLFGDRKARATCEWTRLENSPAQQSRTGFIAGASGDLVRLQLWTIF